MKVKKVKVKMKRNDLVTCGPVTLYIFRLIH